MESEASDQTVQVKIPGDSYKALGELKESGEQDADVVARAVEFYTTYHLLAKGASNDFKTSLGTCTKAATASKKLKGAGYSEEKSSCLCRAIYGERTDADLLQAFQLFDKDTPGSVSLAKFKTDFELMCGATGVTKVEETWALAVTEMTEKITLAEFTVLLKALGPQEGSDFLHDSLAGVGSWFADLGAGASHIQGAYRAGLTDLSSLELRKAGAILAQFEKAGYSEEDAATVCRALLGDQDDEHMKKAFAIFDVKKSQDLDAEEFKKALPLMGENAMDDQAHLEAAYSLCDSNKNGKIDYDEFVAMVKAMNPKGGAEGGGLMSRLSSISGETGQGIGGAVSEALGGLSGWFGQAPAVSDNGAAVDVPQEGTDSAKEKTEAPPKTEAPAEPAAPAPPAVPPEAPAA